MNALAIARCGFCGAATLGTSLCEDCIPYTWPFMEGPVYGRSRIEAVFPLLLRLEALI